jgi:hypothetical protein
MRCIYVIQGCLMSETDYDGRSALHLAAAEGHLECVKVHTHCPTNIVYTMDQISLKTPNPKCRLFLKIHQERYLAAGVYLSEAPDPPPLLHTV